MTIYVGYNKRSFSTAKAIRDSFLEKGEDCRIINDKKFKKKPKIFIRWGNSYKEAPEGSIEINSMEAVKRTSNKLRMAYALIKKEGVNFPTAYISPLSAARLLEEEGMMESGQNQLEGFQVMQDNMDLYYRNSSGVVRRRSSRADGDLYGTAPIDRAREFRVHVFNGRTLGVYEKIPHSEDQLYCKNDNCDFRRIDMAEESNREALRGVRPMTRLAVEALGLVFGGVDVIISKSGEIFVNEVNSAPSLNSINIDRYYEEIKNYVKELEENGTED